MNFSNLSLNNTLVKTLENLSYKEATPIQIQSIPLILAKEDVMARAQTGTGKTAAFALPILHNIAEKHECGMPLTALVLVPTRELAQQVHSSFKNYSKGLSINIGLVYGGVSIKQQVKELNQGVNILVATPGRLLDLLNSNDITLQEINTLVFDEADRILDLGFKDEIDRILSYIPIQRQTLLFTATLSDDIYKLSNTLLNKPKIIEVDEKNVTADKIEQVIYQVDENKKREITSFLIGSRNWQQVLVFTRTKQCADDLAKEMIKDGVKSVSIHGDKSQGARAKALSEFKEGKVRALIATDVAARGIDIKELCHVINYELPYNAEDYIHRIGRTARAGNSGLAVSLVSPKEEWLLQSIEDLLDTKLIQQWLPGYEPDLTIIEGRESRNISKKNARKKALSTDYKSTKSRKRRR